MSTQALTPTTNDPGEPPADFVPRKTSIRGMATTALLMTVVLTILTGLIYPMVMIGISQVLFNHQANGSLIEVNGKIVGSSLIGQEFGCVPGTKCPAIALTYFWDRLSASDYNAMESGGTNLGPTNKVLVQNTVAEASLIRKVNGLPANYLLPSDAVSSSASGLDPDISPAYADLQVPRVARVRGLSEATVMAMVKKYTEGRTFDLLGEPRVNVLELNLALDALKK